MDKEILTMEEAAELFSVSVKTFIKLLKEEKVPARKIGREWRFSRRALIEWLSSGDSQVYSAREGEVRAFFNEVAPDWEDIRKNYYDESIKNKLIEMQLLKKNMAVMDLGAGDGYISRAIAKLVKKVVAVDISGEMLKELRKKARESGIKNIEIIESDGQDVPIKSASIDVICASMYLHHIEDTEVAIREIKRIAKPQGVIFLADFYEHSNTELKEKMHDVWPGFKPNDVELQFKNNGFENIKLERLFYKSENSSILSIFVLTCTRQND